MRACPTCGEVMSYPGVNECDECDRKRFYDGCLVKSQGRTGRAFIKNSKDQWLVVWDSGSVGIVHQYNLDRL